MNQFVTIPVGTTGADAVRCADYAAFLRRLCEAEGRILATPNRQQTAETALLTLLQQGCLFFHGQAPVEIWYVPSRKAKAKVLSEQGHWPEAIHKKHVEAFRAVPGAIIRFPVEGEETTLDVFITDWSPSPAAGAVAVHRLHPIAANLDLRRSPCFTGKFVRQPLTGDLLPVWVADWVRPEVGTGAVLVNPAHDHVDDKFARAVGLPIRFGLVPDTFTGRPDTWPVPPVIKTGRTIKTGFFDGHTVEEALDHYFALLKEYGLAERFADSQVGKRLLAELHPDPEGSLIWCEDCSGLRPWQHNPGCPRCVQPGARVRLSGGDLVNACLDVDPVADLTLVSPSAEQKEGLLFMRLLYADLYEQALQPSDVHVVNRVQESQVPIGHDVLRVCALVGAPAGQVAALRQQIVEQVQRFLDTHAQFLSTAAAATGGAEPAGPIAKGLKNTKAALIEHDLAKAFALLYPLQKQLRAIPPEQQAHDGAFAGYFSIVQVMLGLAAHPATIDPVQGWRTL